MGHHPVKPNALRPRLARPHGFTLIEAMVVLAVVAIMATIAAPSMSAFVRNAQLRGTTNELATALQYARSESIKRGLPVTVCQTANANAATPTCASTANAAWATGWLVFVDHALDGQYTTTAVSGNPADVLLRVHAPMVDGLTLSGGTNFGRYVAYVSSGVSRGDGGLSNGTFGICLQGQGRTVDVSTTGRVNVSSTNC